MSGAGSPGKGWSFAGYSIGAVMIAATVALLLMVACCCGTWFYVVGTDEPRSRPPITVPTYPTEGD